MTTHAVAFSCRPRVGLMTQRTRRFVTMAALVVMVGVVAVVSLLR